MSPEQTPPDRSDERTSPAMEKLRRFVTALTSSEDSIVTGRDSQLQTTQLGDHLTMEATRFSPPENFTEELIILLPEHILELSIYNSGKFVESIGVSDGNEGVLLIDQSGDERSYLDFSDRHEADIHITEFFERYNLDGMYQLLSQRE